MHLKARHQLHLSFLCLGGALGDAALGEAALGEAAVGGDGNDVAVAAASAYLVVGLQLVSRP